MIYILVQKKHQKRKANFNIDFLLIYFLRVHLALNEDVSSKSKYAELSRLTQNSNSVFLVMHGLISVINLIRTHMVLRCVSNPVKLKYSSHF